MDSFYFLHVNRIYKSAFKHGVNRQDIQVASRGIFATFREDDDPVKIIGLGYDSHARLLELGIIIAGNQAILIHAMKARKKYVELIEEKRYGHQG